MELPAEFYHKIEVLYLLSQGTEQADHPHMIQVQYPSHQRAPTLRDVKSRLTALRGKGMPDSYSWSYKRSYKGTFIWCDLFDDDVILPISQSGEYVLKALEVIDASQDAFDREADQPSQEAVQSAKKIPPTLNGSGVSFTTSKLEITQPDGVHNTGYVRKTASFNCSELKQKSAGGFAYTGIETKAWGNEQTSTSTSASTSVSEDFIENKRCLEKVRRSESSTSVNGTNSSTGTQTEPCAISDDNSDIWSSEREVKMEVNELMSGPLMRSTDYSETSTRAFPSSEVFRKGPVKSRTWVVKEEDISAPINERTLRRCSGELYERDPMVSTSRDIPSSPGARPCFPGHPLMFMLKKAARFRRSQLCRRVEVVETFRALPLEEPSFSRYSSKSRHGIGSKKVAPKPHFSKIVTLKSKPQRNRRSSEEPDRESRCLSEFLETSKSRSSSLRVVNEGVKKAGSARHVRSDSKDAFGTAGCKEVGIVPPAVLLPERVAREDEKFVSDSKILAQPGVKSFKMDTKSGVRQASKPGVEPPSSLFSPAPAQALQLPTVSRSQEIIKERTLKQHRSLVTGLADTTTSVEISISGADSALKSQDLKTLKVPRNVSKNCYFSLPIPGAEKKTSDTKVYPSRESSVFGSAALHSDNMQEVKMVNAKLEVQAAPATGTSCREGGSMRPKDSPPKHRGFKTTREQRPLTLGLTELHWEGSLQEAVHPPKDLILHECVRCGRTFKADSLKVHLRGCHVINKPKKSVVLRKRVSM